MANRTGVLVCVLLSLFPLGIAPLDADMPRIRAVDPWLGRLIQSGAAQSDSFRTIVDRLQQSNVVVHVEPRRPGHGSVIGTLRFVTYAGGFRYLRVTIVMPASSKAAIALLGHELTHAAEVAADPSVVDHASFERLYRRIGDRCFNHGATRGYDTRAARDAGDRIFAELHDAGRQRAY